MEQNQGDSIKNASSSEQIADRSQLKAKRNLIIRRCFRKPMAISLEQLQKWHEEYNAAAADDLESDNAILEEVESDELDENAIEKCIAELAEEVPATDRFCGECQHLFDNWPDLGDPGFKDPSTGLHCTVAQECHTLVLEAAARKGCRFCAFVVQVMRDAKLLETFRKVEARLEYLDNENKAMISLSLQSWGGNDPVQWLWINFPGKVCDSRIDGIAHECNFESTALEPSADTYDKQRDVLDIANIWINRCTENHEDCNEKKDQDALPTRLVSIAGEVPRLVLTAGWETRPRYSTLSHRWGIEDFLKLTEENYNSFLSTIPLHELRETFRDAIHISRRLGLDYIWIDSLCIIQGSTEDWEREAGLMSSVYGGSFVNIAAASAVNVHEGCFLKLPYLVDGLRASITVNGSSLVRDFRSRSVYDMSVTKSHLATRAWAVQEKILPPRTIHFGNRGAFWECKVTTANEFLPDGFPDQVDDEFLDQVGDETPNQVGGTYPDHIGRCLTNERFRQESFRYWWREVVGLYSGTDLTYSQDKLPALSGIARRIYEERGGQYIAGMWREEDIEAQLCWETSTCQERPPWRAPSWSWASVDGRVSYPIRHPGAWGDKFYAHVLDAEMTFQGQNSFGEVRGGWLRIGCSGMLAARSSGLLEVVIEAGGKDTNADKDYLVLSDCLDDDPDWRLSGDTVYLLPLLGERTGNLFKTSGILLTKRAGVAGQFRRIGKFAWLGGSQRRLVTYGRKDKGNREPILEAFGQGAASVAESVCAEVIENVEYPDERYVIYVV